MYCNNIAIIGRIHGHVIHAFFPLMGIIGSQYIFTRVWLNCVIDRNQTLVKLKNYIDNNFGKIFTCNE
jgi:hypothetical protein